MHASMFHLDLGRIDSHGDRWRAGLSLAAALNAVDGFVAFLALETEDGAVAGLCICIDIPSLEAARQVAEEWQREHSEQTLTDMQALITGEVIVQQGF
jgi:hypothetical protein